MTCNMNGFSEKGEQMKNQSVCSKPSKTVNSLSPSLVIQSKVYGIELNFFVMKLPIPSFHGGHKMLP